jgi:hypothetical protein
MQFQKHEFFFLKINEKINFFLRVRKKMKIKFRKKNLPKQKTQTGTSKKSNRFRRFYEKRKINNKRSAKKRKRRNGRGKNCESFFVIFCFLPLILF